MAPTKDEGAPETRQDEKARHTFALVFATAFPERYAYIKGERIVLHETTRCRLKEPITAKLALQ